jgi:hypothetical protein
MHACVCVYLYVSTCMYARTHAQALQQSCMTTEPQESVCMDAWMHGMWHVACGMWHVLACTGMWD